MAAERASIGQFLCTLPTPYGNRILLACHTFLRPVQLRRASRLKRLYSVIGHSAATIFAKSRIVK